MSKPAWSGWKKGGRAQPALWRQTRPLDSIGRAAGAVARRSGVRAPHACTSAGGGGDSVGRRGQPCGASDEQGRRSAVRRVGGSAAAGSGGGAAGGHRAGLFEAFSARDGQPPATVNPVL